MNDSFEFLAMLSPGPTRVGTRLTISFNLVNTGPKPIFVNNRWAVAPSIGDVILRVVLGEEEIGFRYRVRLRPLSSEDFVDLQPDECVHGAFELTHGFDLSRPGVYTVSAEYCNREVPPFLEGRDVFVGTLRSPRVSCAIIS